MINNLNIIDDFSKWISESKNIKYISGYSMENISFDFLIKWFSTGIPIDICWKIENIENECIEICKWQGFLGKNNLKHRMKQVWNQYATDLKLMGLDIFDFVEKPDFDYIYEMVANYKKEKKVACNYRKIPGYIYLIHCRGYYKIGKSRSLDSRMKKYITENPDEVDVICSYKVDDYTEEEKRLHELFKEKNHNREWFNLSEEDITYIKTLGNGETNNSEEFCSSSNITDKQ